MSNAKPVAYGRVRGAIVELEHPVPELEGQRVRVEPSAAQVLAPEDPDLSLTPEDNARLLLEWRRLGPDGPISDEDAGID